MASYIAITENGQEDFKSRKEYAHRYEDFPLWERLEYYLKFDHWNTKEAFLLLSGLIPEIIESGLGRHYETYWGETTFTDDGHMILQSAIDLQHLYEGVPDRLDSMLKTDWIRWAQSKECNVPWLDIAIRKSLISASRAMRSPTERRIEARRLVHEFKSKSYKDFNKRAAQAMGVSVQRLKQLVTEND